MKYDKSYNILLVDDDPQIIALITDSLKEQPFNFLHANNVQNALFIASKKKVDLIITDWDMPEQSGIDLIKKFKTDSSNVNIPIIMLTGVNTESGSLSLAFEVGADDFVRKPFNTIELLARVNATLKFYDLKKKQIKSEKKYLEQELKKSIEMTTQKVTELIRMNNKRQTTNVFLDDIISDCNTIGAEKIKTYKRTLNLECQEISENEILLYFEKNNPLFLKTLEIEFPALTKKDRFICILVCLNLSNREIAELLINSENTIKTDRKRLRQKLNITKEEDLKDYLHKNYNLKRLESKIDQ